MTSVVAQGPEHVTSSGIMCVPDYHGCDQEYPDLGFRASVMALLEHQENRGHETTVDGVVPVGWSGLWKMIVGPDTEAAAAVKWAKEAGAATYKAAQKAPDLGKVAINSLSEAAVSLRDTTYDWLGVTGRHTITMRRRHAFVPRHRAGLPGLFLRPAPARVR